MKVDVLGFNPSHLLSMKPKWVYDYEEDLIESTSSSISERGGLGWTLVVDGKNVMCFGCCYVRRGVVEVWSITTDLVYYYPKTCVKTIKSYFKDVSEKVEVWRVQATVRADYLEGQRFLEYLGFEKEGLMKCFGQGREDHFMYGRLIS